MECVTANFDLAFDQWFIAVNRDKSRRKIWRAHRNANLAVLENLNLARSAEGLNGKAVADVAALVR